MDPIVVSKFIDDGRRVLAYGGGNDDAVSFKLWLVKSRPYGELEITMEDGVTWVTQVGIAEIAMFGAKRDDLLEIYMDEMVRNARAALRPRVH